MAFCILFLPPSPATVWPDRSESLRGGKRRRRTMPVEKWSESVVVVHLGNNPQFTDDLESLEARLAQGRVDAVLDLSSVGFINSSNIARLLKVRKAMVSSDGRLVLCSVNNQ